MLFPKFIALSTKLAQLMYFKMILYNLSLYFWGFQGLDCSEEVGTVRARVIEQSQNVSAGVPEYSCPVTAGSLSSGFVFQFVMLLLAFLMERELELKSVSCSKIPSS